jgi:hypothetical protein
MASLLISQCYFISWLHSYAFNYLHREKLAHVGSCYFEPHGLPSDFQPLLLSESFASFHLAALDESSAEAAFHTSQESDCFTSEFVAPWGNQSSILQIVQWC